VKEDFFFYPLPSAVPDGITGCHPALGHVVFILVLVILFYSIWQNVISRNSSKLLDITAERIVSCPLLHMGPNQ
jgi:hypothetical protein